MSTTAPDERGHEPGQSPPGSDATTPTEIPSGGWKQIALRTRDQIKSDRVGLMSAGVAFYAMLAIFPTIIAALTVWGLVAEPEQIQQTMDSYSSQLPDGAGELVSSQVSRIAENSDSSLGWALFASLAAALWSASSGTKGLMNAVNAAYDEPETRGFLKTRGMALALTVGGVFFGLILVGLIAVIPALLGTVGLGSTAEELLRWGRWPLLALALMVGLTVIYRYAPDRDHPQWRWLGWGSGVAVVVWLLASAGFAWYVTEFGSFGETYGSIAGVIVLMLWFFLSAFAILLGAEVNAEMEHQTRHDTTTGPPEPMGRRGAHVADVPPPREQ